MYMVSKKLLGGRGHCMGEGFATLIYRSSDNFDQLLNSPFHHFVQEVNEIWYPGRAVIKLLRYQISLTSCTKWRNDKGLNVSKLFCGTSVPFLKVGQTYNKCLYRKQHTLVSRKYTDCTSWIQLS